MTLKYPVSAGDTVLEFNEPLNEWCALLAKPSHLFLTIYTAARNETVVATHCDPTGRKLTVVRGAQGTKADSWPACACVGLIREEPGLLCENPELDKDAACCECLEGITASGSFTLERGPCSVAIALAPTGVAAGEYCGARVNTFGQLTFIPEGWPYNCLPVFNPCGPCDTGGPGGGTAMDITYTPLAGACVALGGDVQTVLEQIDAALCSLSTPSAGVLSVSGGTGISVTGAGTSPTVSLSPVGIAPGVYNGFSVNAFGQITSYAPPAAGAEVVVVGTAPITVSYDIGTKTYTVGVNLATSDEAGGVLVADTAEATGYDPTVPATAAAGEKAATVESVYAMLQQAQLDANALAFNIASLVAESEMPSGTYLVFYDGAHKRILREDAIRALGGAFARGAYSVSLPGLTDSLNVASAAATGPTTVRVTMSVALLPDYHVSVAPRGPTPRAWSTEWVSDQVFDIHFATAIPDFTFTVTEI